MKFILLLIVAIFGYLYATGRLKNMMNRNDTPSMSERQARTLLGVDRASNNDAIIAAHRQMMAKHHPDRGGNAEIARQLNEARDILLARQPEQDLK
ncbi:J domain-containing protein [Sphingorhabdus sp. Alg239-R122]|uniref:J domain-containing protein n=1 Tax=Sphingorhabdus sp. Alg239-R122 TaxID=2305989 RepID=UPI0013DC91AB|nr:J domain-containing protein [Sphingorhabdus sp. Alg239-R122]